MNYVEIKFKGGRKQAYKNPQEFPLRIGDLAIVEAERGYDLGKVSVGTILANITAKTEEHFEIIRKPNKNDLQRLEENRDLESQFYKECRILMKEFNPLMKLADIEFQFDRSKISFYFTADKRIDFRELVKELASRYKTRIELRQIGVRDEAKRIGGCGVCGLELCCTTFLKGFEPVSSQFAKEQGLTLNASKLSGSCGRLKCCLVYERDFYIDELKNYPEIDAIYKVSGVPLLIDKIDVFKNKIYFRNLLDNFYEAFSLNEWKQLSAELLLKPEEVENMTRPDFTKFNVLFNPNKAEVEKLRDDFAKKLDETKNGETSEVKKQVSEKPAFKPEKKIDGKKQKGKDAPKKEAKEEQKPIKVETQKAEEPKKTSLGIPVPPIATFPKKEQIEAKAEEPKKTSLGIPVPPIATFPKKVSGSKVEKPKE
ncbi:hypothetical protein IT568_11840 [bacterium]|nr:hypothetical protein [bacterium]